MAGGVGLKDCSLYQSPLLIPRVGVNIIAYLPPICNIQICYSILTGKLFSKVSLWEGAESHHTLNGFLKCNERSLITFLASENLGTSKLDQIAPKQLGLLSNGLN